MTDTDEIIKAARKIVEAQKNLFPEERAETDMISMYNTAQVVHLVVEIRAMSQLLPPEIPPCPAGHEAELHNYMPGERHHLHSIDCNDPQCGWELSGEDPDKLLEYWSKRA